MPRKIREAIEDICDVRVSSGCTLSEQEKWFKAIDILRDVAQLHLQAASELPPRDIAGHNESCKGTTVRDCTCGASNVNETWNDCLDQVTPIVARKNEEVALLKKENEGYKNLIKNCPQAQVCPYVKTISFTPDLELAKKVIEEQREELEACRDANVQKKKRIASLEDALKRAEGIPSVEDIENQLSEVYFAERNLAIPLDVNTQKKV